MPQPTKIGKINFSTLSLPEQLAMSQIIDAVNAHSGYSGPLKLADGLDLSGNRITNVGPAQGATDVLTSGVAEGKYSAAALKPSFQAGSSQPLDTYRILNSGSQREVQSSFLNDLMSTPPSANAIVPLTANSLSSGVINASSLTNAGTSGYTTASSLPTTTSGSGTGATATIVASGGVISSGSVTGGINYALGDKVYPTQGGSSADAYFTVTGITNGGTVTATIPTGPFVFADNSRITLESRVDILTPPVSYAIASISCVGNVVTVVTVNPITVVVGSAVTITGVSPAGFNGSVPVTSYTAPHTFTYNDDLGTVGGSGGNVEVLNTYYYTVKKRSPQVFLIGPVSGDTAQNRLTANFDGSQIVAVIVLTNSGSQVPNSGGGGSAIIGSPTAGCFF